MTKEALKVYLSEQVDMMDETELQEFLNFIERGKDEEEIIKELLIIKGEFKKLTKLVQLMKKDFDTNNHDHKIDKIEPFINFYLLLKNSKDAIDSLPMATFFGKTKTNKSIKSLQKGFNSVETKYEDILNQIGVKVSAKVGDKFDSSLHEIVEVIEDENIENGTIVDIIEDGFLYRNEIINYAKVKVNKWT